MFEGQSLRAATVGSCGGQMARPSSPPPAAENESDSQIRNALCFTEDLASQVHCEIAAIERRLETGLTPVHPSTESCGTPKTDSLAHSAVLERVAAINAALQTANVRLRELRMRVEL